MKYGTQNSNYKHGVYSTVPDHSDVKIACAKAALRKVFTAAFDGAGNPKGVTGEEQAWALKIQRARPAWAEATLKEVGL